ncbi:hypothetical protein ES703_54532 [subsurface metagenome]
MAKTEYGVHRSNMAVSQDLKRRGIDVHASHGPNKAFPTRESLERAAEALGLDAEFLNGEEGDGFDYSKLQG